MKIIRLVLHLTDLYGQNFQSLNIMRFLLMLFNVKLVISMLLLNLM